jgi:hypothetical protein
VPDTVEVVDPTVTGSIFDSFMSCLELPLRKVETVSRDVIIRDRMFCPGTIQLAALTFQLQTIPVAQSFVSKFMLQ